MKDSDRKVLKLGISSTDLERFVSIKERKQLRTVAETLTMLIDFYEQSDSKV